MQEDNKGFTLVEVVVCTVIISLMLAGLVMAFMSVRKVNYTASKQDVALDLASSMLESLRGVAYTDIGTVDLLPDADSTFLDNDTEKVWIYRNIDRGSGVFKATLAVTPSSKDINDAQFPNVLDIAKDSTVVIDTKTMTTIYGKDEYDKYIRQADNSFEADHSNSYDALTLYELVDMNVEYISGLYEERCREIDEQNELYGGVIIPYPPFGSEAVYGVDEFAFIPEDEILKLVDRELRVYTGNTNTYKEIDCSLIYTMSGVDCERIFGQSKEFEYRIYSSKYLNELDNLYILYEPTDFNKDSVTVVNGNTADETLVYNLFFIVGNTYNKAYANSGIYMADNIQNLEFDYTQASSIDKQVILYTNYEFITPGIYITKKSYNMYESLDARTRLYDVSITIEDENGTNLYSDVKTSILK